MICHHEASWPAPVPRMHFNDGVFMHLRLSVAPQSAPFRLSSVRCSVILAMVSTLVALAPGAHAQAKPATPPERPPSVEELAKPADKTPERGPLVRNSSLDGNLFYQLLIGEIQARDGDFGTSYQLYFE